MLSVRVPLATPPPPPSIQHLLGQERVQMGMVGGGGDCEQHRSRKAKLRESLWGEEAEAGFLDIGQKTLDSQI